MNDFMYRILQLMLLGVAMSTMLVLTCLLIFARGHRRLRGTAGADRLLWLEHLRAGVTLTCAS